MRAVRHTDHILIVVDRPRESVDASVEAIVSEMWPDSVRMIQTSFCCEAYRFVKAVNNVLSLMQVAEHVIWANPRA